MISTITIIKLQSAYFNFRQKFTMILQINQKRGVFYEKVFDYSTLVNKKYDKEIINYIGLIHEFKGRHELFLNQRKDDLDKLIEISKIQSTKASNEIEGIITTKQRLKELMGDKTTPRNRSEKEIQGYRYALNMVHESFEYIPIKSNTILQLHKEMYQFLDVRFGGKFKDTSNEIDAVYPDSKKTVLFKPQSHMRFLPPLSQSVKSTRKQ